MNVIQRATQHQHLSHDGTTEMYSRVNGIIPVETARSMVQMAIKDVQNPNVAGVARWIVRDLVDENMSPFAAIMSEVQAIENFVIQRIRYTRDPYGVELVYSPSRVVDFISRYTRWAEDCDTQALLILTFFLAIGRQARLVIAGFHEKGIYTHVFCEVFVPSEGEMPARWVIVDPSTGKNVAKMASSIKTSLRFYPSGKIEPLDT